MDKPKVSVCVVTYNQKNYIKDCLESLVSQETNFPFEIIVGDDASTDGAADIIYEFANQYPHLIKLVMHKENCGPLRNYFSVHNIAKGDYIAHMDGDDYAMPHKLQLQKKFLDTHPECSMVFHECQILQKNGYLNQNSTSKKNIKICNFLEFLYLYPNTSVHSSKMYRQSAIKSRTICNRNFIDNHLHFEHGLSGKTGFINQFLGVYRENIGISSDMNYLQEAVLDSYQYAKELGYDSKMLSKVISRKYFEHGLRSLEIGDYKYFKKWVNLGFKSGYISLSSLLAFCFQNHPKQYIQTRKILREIRQQLFLVKKFYSTN